MNKIAYVLHRFPAKTDTFIKREIRSLQRAGMDVQVISVWRPTPIETTSETMSEWSRSTHFVLPRPVLSIFVILIASFVRSPRRFVQTGLLALKTARPGVRGLLYQAVYFIEAIIAAKILRNNKFNHAHNHIGDQSGTVTMLAASMTGIGYSITFHGWPVFFDATYSRIKEKVLGAQFTRSISYFCRSQLMMFSGQDDPESFKVVHCGLDLDRYPYRQPRLQVERLFCVARLSPEKGLTFLIQALKLLINRGIQLDLALAGDGPSTGRLKDLARELGVSDRIQFLGYLPEDDVVRELQKSDLFVLPSLVEGLPVSAMEAMAVGVPVIATNIAGTSELVEHGKSGILVRPSDAHALAEAISSLIENYEFRRNAAELARKKVVAEFKIDDETAKLHACFLQACEPGTSHKITDPILGVNG